MLSSLVPKKTQNGLGRFVEQRKFVLQKKEIN